MTTNEELARTLNCLHEQLSHSPQLDEATVQSLRALLDEIEAATMRNAALTDSGYLPETDVPPETYMPAEISVPVETAAASQGNAGTEETEDLSLSQRMRKVIEDFESRHPQLTINLSQVADSLAEMGF